MSRRPYVWEMVNEAVNNLDGKASYSEIRDFIKHHYDEVNENTITAQTIVCTVNHNSRIHYPENNKPRIADSKYDFLFTTGRGQVELYDPKKHGIWEIAEDDFGKLIVKKKSDEKPIEDEENDFAFPLEDHLRDFIAQNLESIKINGKQVMLYVDDSGIDGVEYKIDVGFIDLLAVDEQGNFIVFELKRAKAPDSAIGQILRYMGWIKENMASDKDVKGVIVSKKADEKIKYAASMVPEINLFEYELAFQIQEVTLDNDNQI